jgi:lycopene cyclase domain-containing protein
MRKYYYLLTLSFVFCIPTLVAAYLLSDVVSLSELVPFIVLVTIIGSLWDVWATRHSKRDRVWLWQFHRSQTLGIRFLGLPIEEYLFYVASSIYIIYMWEGIKIMSRGGDKQVYLVIFGLAAWTFISILIPYIFRKRGDKFIG